MRRNLSWHSISLTHTWPTFMGDTSWSPTTLHCLAERKNHATKGNTTPPKMAEQGARVEMTRCPRPISHLVKSGSSKPCRGRCRCSGSSAGPENRPRRRPLRMVGSCRGFGVRSASVTVLGVYPSKVSQWRGGKGMGLEKAEPTLELFLFFPSSSSTAKETMPPSPTQTPRALLYTQQTASIKEAKGCTSRAEGYNLRQTS